MQTFYYSEPEKVLYIYNADMLTTKIFDVCRIERQIKTSAFLVYGMRGELSALIFGTQLNDKLG